MKELRGRRFDLDSLDRDAPSTEVDLWTAFWRACADNALPALTARLLQLESEIRPRPRSRSPKKIPELVGPIEIAQMCGVGEAEVFEWIEAGLLPEPYRILSDVPCWLRFDAENWARQAGRLPE